MSPVQPPDPWALSWEQSFELWARNVIAAEAIKHPGRPMYRLEDFDGCTAAPDEARWACLLHDLRYHYARTTADRLDADRLLRADLILMGAADPGYGWLWWLRGWVAFLAVRAFGRSHVTLGAAASI